MVAAGGALSTCVRLRNRKLHCLFVQQPRSNSSILRKDPTFRSWALCPRSRQHEDSCSRPAAVRRADRSSARGGEKRRPNVAQVACFASSASGQNLSEELWCAA